MFQEREIITISYKETYHRPDDSAAPGAISDHHTKWWLFDCVVKRPVSSSVGTMEVMVKTTGVGLPSAGRDPASKCTDTRMDFVCSLDKMPVDDRRNR